MSSVRQHGLSLYDFCIPFKYFKAVQSRNLRWRTSFCKFRWTEKCDHVVLIYFLSGGSGKACVYLFTALYSTSTRLGHQSCTTYPPRPLPLQQVVNASHPLLLKRLPFTMCLGFSESDEPVCDPKAGHKFLLVVTIHSHSVRLPDDQFHKNNTSM